MDHDTIVRYDALCEIATALTGYYAAEMNQAPPETRQWWMDRILQLRDERQRIDPADQETVTRTMERWKRELAEFRSRS